MNSVSSNKHASQQQGLATSWVYRWESISCCVTFAQYLSLLEFPMPSLEFHYVLWLFYVLLNKTPVGNIVLVYECFGYIQSDKVCMAEG
jgi:ribose/xylose/arabinose/galactoside ABC-type transport system permease subunit